MMTKAWCRTYSPPEGVPPPKQNGPLRSGPFVVEINGPVWGLISWPVRAPEPEQVPGRELAQEPMRAQGLVREQAPVRRASSSQRVQVRAPVCWLPAALREPDVRRFFRKRNTRQSQG